MYRALTRDIEVTVEPYYLEDQSDFLDDIGCDYEPDNAPDCIDALKEAGRTCEENDLEDMFEACYEDLYDC